MLLSVILVVSVDYLLRFRTNSANMQVEGG